MKTRLLLIILFLNVFFILNSENGSDRSENLFYYIPTEEQATDYFSLFNYLRYTKNKKIQSRILTMIKNNKINDTFARSLFRLYNSKEEKIIQNDKTQIQYNYNNQYYDENINLFTQAEKLLFNNELDRSGILSRSGADRIYLGIGVGPDIIPEIDSGCFKIFLLVKLYFYRISDYYYSNTKNTANYLRTGYGMIIDIFRKRNMEKSVFFMNRLVKVLP
jgi:hypothetical protein